MDQVREDFRWYCDAMLRRLGRSSCALDITTVRSRMLKQPGFKVQLSEHTKWPARPRGYRHLQDNTPDGACVLVKNKQNCTRHSLVRPDGVARAAMQIAFDGRDALSRVESHRKLLALSEWIEKHSSPNVVDAVTLDEGRARAYPHLRPMLIAAEKEPIWEPDPDEEWRSHWALLGLEKMEG